MCQVGCTNLFFFFSITQFKCTGTCSVYDFFSVLFQLLWVVHFAARIMFTFISLSAVQNMIHFIYFNTCHFHHDRVYYELTMACSPVGLINSVGG